MKNCLIEKFSQGVGEDLRIYPHHHSYLPVYLAVLGVSRPEAAYKFQHLSAWLSLRKLSEDLPIIRRD